MFARANAHTLRVVALAQALVYILTGLWAIIGPKSFQAVTGPKTDVWLVQTVGALVSVIGFVLGVAGGRRHLTPEMVILGTGSAAALTAIDVAYVARRRIAHIYLLDALAECLLITGWVIAWIKRRD